MGTLTLSQLRAEIQANLGGRDNLSSSDTDSFNDVLTRIINLQQERMARKYSFEELEQRVSGVSVPYTGTKATDRFIAWSTISSFDPLEVHSVTLYETDSGESRPRKLVAVRPRHFDNMRPRPESDTWATGMPTHYVNWQEKFELWPIPDQAYEMDIRFAAWPTALSADGDTSDFDRKDDIIIQMATSYAYNRLGQYEKAGRFFGIAMEMLRDAISEDTEKVDEVIAAFTADNIGGRETWRDPFSKR